MVPRVCTPTTHAHRQEWIDAISKVSKDIMKLGLDGSHKAKPSGGATGASADGKGTKVCVCRRGGGLITLCHAVS